MTIQEIEKQIKELQEELETRKSEKEDRIEKYLYSRGAIVINQCSETIKIIFTGETPYDLLEREYRKLQLEWELRKLLYDNNAIPSEEDWENRSITKYSIQYDYILEENSCNIAFNCKNQGVIYSLNRELLENWFNELSEEDKEIFVRG